MITCRNIETNDMNLLTYLFITEVVDVGSLILKPVFTRAVVYESFQFGSKKTERNSFLVDKIICSKFNSFYLNI